MSLESIYEESYIEQKRHEEEIIDSLSEEELKQMEREEFENIFATDKKSLLSQIDDIARDLTRSISIKHTIGYLNLFTKLLEKFKLRIQEAYIMDCDKTDWWYYDVKVYETGIDLNLCYERPHFNKKITGGDTVYVEYNGASIEEEYTIMSVKSKLLTVEEFAKNNDVSPITVRQWIRRGKIKSAIKAGSEWRIPELCEIDARGYKIGWYSWNDTVCDVPEKYNFLNNYTGVTIFQNPKNKKEYNVEFWKHIKLENGKMTSEKKKLIMDKREREEFELFLISNPIVKASARELGDRYYGDSADK